MENKKNEGMVPLEEKEDLIGQGLPPGEMVIEDEVLEGGDEEMETISEDEALQPFPEEKRITVDNTDGEVLEWDKEGREVYFSEGSLFKKLPTNIVRQLSMRTKSRYYIAKGITEESLSIGKTGTRDEVIRDLRQKFSVPGGTATDKLKVRGGKSDMVYSHFNVVRLGYAEQRGWEPVTDSSVTAYSDDKTGESKVLKNQKGDIEMVLMAKPREVHETEQAELQLYRRAMRGRLSEQDLVETGKAGFDPEQKYTDKKIPWRTIK